MSTEKLYTEIDVIRAKCMNDFSFFVRYFFKKRNNKKFNVSKHHNELFKICHEINAGEHQRLIVNIAPRYGKTEVMVKMFIAWSLALNPSARFIHLSYSDSLALDNSSEIKDLINSAEYQELFPYVQIKKDTKAKEKWYTTENGGVLARSSSGQVTGFGAGQTDFDNEMIEFGGAIIIDDPIKPDDANSETMRNRVNMKFETTIRNRVNSSKTPIIIIMQRLHPDDLCGYLIENERESWTVIKFPVINENGEPLWREKHSIEELLEMESKQPLIFATQYMQDPEPLTGYLIPFKTLRLFPNESSFDTIRRICFIDPAEKNGDYISCIFAELRVIESKLTVHIYDVIHTNNGFEYAVPLIHDLAVNTNVDEVYFEKNGVGLATGVSLKNLNTENKYKLTPYHTTDNKEAKILTHYEFVRDRFTFNVEYQSSRFFMEFIHHLTRYSSQQVQKHKRDAIDVCCSATKILKIMYKNLL